MASTTTTRSASASSSAPAPAAPGGLRRAARLNWLGGLAGWLWLGVAVIPIYWIVVTSFKSQATYFTQNPLAPPTSPTLDSYRLVLESDFPRYFLNSVIVTLGTTVPAVLAALMAAYAIVRGSDLRVLRLSNALLLMGLAIPIQAVIIPVYLLIIKMRLYDSLVAMILPSIAFALPLAVLVLTNFIRDVPRELFESMRVDGATEWTMLWSLAFPLVRPALVTVSIYTGLTVWNGFILPLILTQSPTKRTLPLALWTFQGQYSVNVPAVLAAVVLTTLPIAVLYAFGRRQLVSGLTAGFSK